ncbi:DUF1799 domain-containing protein [Nitrosospira lacus]|uniref:DUF1799 domain-containing protein n=1 Tax=Nitrosospira lacus TaxID=1288494 RepID=UPI0002C53551|nr:DUF1799 domain-containing protein [Nitrosospira lacus]
MEEDLRAFGITVEPEANEDAAEDNAFGVWKENVKTVEFFLSVLTQWRVHGMTGAILGFEYPGIVAAMAMNGIRNQKRLFADLRIMESAAMEILNRER